jgi:hypothetical protein
MKNNYLYLFALVILPTTAYAHNPGVIYLIVGAVLVVPGIIAAVIAKSYKFIWFISVFPLIMLSFFLMNLGLNKTLSLIEKSGDTRLNLKIWGHET